jgi:hypothetical protein
MAFLPTVVLQGGEPLRKEATMSTRSKRDRE